SAGLQLAFSYDPSVYSRGAISRLSSQFVELVQSALASPQTPVDQLNLLPPQQRQQLLVDWNQTHKEIAPLCVHQLSEQHARLTPEAIALVCQGQSLTYRELNARSNQLAHWLLQQGVGTDTLVGLYLE